MNHGKRLIVTSLHHSNLTRFMNHGGHEEVIHYIEAYEPEIHIAVVAMSRIRAEHWIRDNFQITAQGRNVYPPTHFIGSPWFDPMIEMGITIINNPRYLRGHSKYTNFIWIGEDEMLEMNKGDYLDAKVRAHRYPESKYDLNRNRSNEYHDPDTIYDTIRGVTRYNYYGYRDDCNSYHARARTLEPF